jgi:uncharacterized protein (DUF736 family)
MMGDRRDNTGALFKENDKQGEKSPDYRGPLTIDGIDYVLAGWVRETQSGQKFLSLAVRRKQTTAEAKPATKPELDDEIPF